jgi:hypothetical protein
VRYHLNEGEISPIIKEIDRKKLTGMQTTSAEGADGTTENPEDLAREQKIYLMEKDCFQQIRNSEKNMRREIEDFRDGEEELINEYKATSNIQDALEKILEKSLTDKARERYS